MAFSLQDRVNHRAGVFAVKPTKPEPTALDRVFELMRLDHQLTRKAAEAAVMKRFPEHASAFTQRG